MIRSVTNYRGKRYSYAVYPGDNAALTVTREGITKTVKVSECSAYVYSLKKRDIRAIGGAHKLWEYIDKCFAEHFCECYAYKIMDWAIDEMIPLQ